ncbi:MAG: hypothetical protein HY402_01325 [Elusimicrobia bacterium]|nr:hypothetical protein [Elusimicrobiota bacterium]
MKNSLKLPILLVALAAASRLLPHPPNVTPIAAMALYGGVYLGPRAAYLVPLAALLASDLFLGWHGTLPFVYLGFALTAFMGRQLRGHKRPAPLLGGIAGSSLLFYLLTNFGVWLTASLYPQNLPGLLACYTAAIPFFRNSLLGDLFFAAALFGLQELYGLKSKRPVAESLI